MKNILTFGVTLDNGEKTVPWKKSGCIIFSQYYDTVEWVAKNISEDIDEEIGVYAGGDKSGIFYHGEWRTESRDKIKKLVKERKVKILVGTEAASEGLNLQTLGTLINFDLPWNPTRLEQRKGRIQRIGQTNVNESAASLALRWLYDQPQVTCVLSGMNSMEMVKENIKTASDAVPGCLSAPREGKI